MTTISIDDSVFVALKGIAHLAHPEIPSSKLAEILAAGVGYRTRASLVADLKTNAWVDRDIDDGLAASRAAEIGVPALPEDFMSSLVATANERPRLLTRDLLQEIARLTDAGNRDAAPSGDDPIDGIDLWTRDRDWTPHPDHYTLRLLLRGMGKPLLIELTTAMWIGRGDGGPDEWTEFLRHARNTWDSYAADYIADKTGGLSLYMNQAIVALVL